MLSRIETSPSIKLKPQAGVDVTQTETNSFIPNPFADLFPPPTETEIASMTESIRAVGQQEPIITHEGTILDGRIRDAACQRLGIKAKSEPFKGDDALTFVITRNIARRHLTPSQRAMIAAATTTLAIGDNQHSEGLSIAKCSAIFGVSDSAIARAKSVRQRGLPELIDAVLKKQLAVSKAANIAKLPKEQQSRLLAALSVLGGAPRANKKSRGPNRKSSPVDNECLQPGDPTRDITPVSSSRPDYVGSSQIEPSIPIPCIRLSPAQQKIVDELKKSWDQAQVPARQTFLSYALKGLNEVDRVLAYLEVIRTLAPETAITAPEQPFGQQVDARRVA